MSCCICACKWQACLSNQKEAASVEQGGPPGTERMTEWNQRVKQTAERTEAELQRLIRYLNDEVVPEVRRESSAALHTAADQLRALAQKMDDRRP